MWFRGQDTVQQPPREPEDFLLVFLHPDSAILRPLSPQSSTMVVEPVATDQTGTLFPSPRAADVLTSCWQADSSIKLTSELRLHPTRPSSSSTICRLWRILVWWSCLQTDHLFPEKLHFFPETRTSFQTRSTTGPDAADPTEVPQCGGCVISLLCPPSVDAALLPSSVWITDQLWCHYSSGNIHINQ